MTWRDALRFKRYGHLFGYGPKSDGVPETIGDWGASERGMPPAPPASRLCVFPTDDTLPMRKAMR